MEVETKYGDFIVTETTTGLMAEKIESGVQFFVDGRWLPHPDCTMDFNLMVQAIEGEYEFQHDL
jgi:hypothetical protein